MSMRGSREGEQAGKQAGDAVILMGEEGKAQGAQGDWKGTSKGQPRMGTDSCQGAASFTVSCHFSI